MKVAIFGLELNRSDISYFSKLLNGLLKADAILFVETQFLKLIQQFGLPIEAASFDSDNGLTHDIDLFISVGGDGTMLRAITYVGDLGIPMVGLNTGRLGFLSTFKKEEADLLVKLFVSGAYTLEKRSLVQLKETQLLGNFVGPNFALNEITISRKDTTSMITVHTHLNDEFLTSYWADGLIVSTPTGSTGYSLSCGGPVITPTAQSLVLTPIAPHNLNARPLVISEKTELRLQVFGREDTHLVSLDSRIATIPDGGEIVITTAPFQINMVVFHTESFLKTLRNKLLWGEDTRN